MTTDLQRSLSPAERSSNVPDDWPDWLAEFINDSFMQVDHDLPDGSGLAWLNQSNRNSLDLTPANSSTEVSEVAAPQYGTEDHSLITSGPNRTLYPSCPDPNQGAAGLGQGIIEPASLELTFALSPQQPLLPITKPSILDSNVHDGSGIRIVDDIVKSQGTSKPQSAIATSKVMESPTQRAFKWIHYDPHTAMHDAGEDTDSSCVYRSKRGRKGPLEVVKREKVRRIRQLGACWRCRLTKKPCDDGIPCRQCIIQEYQKGLSLCFRSALDDLSEVLLPKRFIRITTQDPVEILFGANPPSWTSRYGNIHIQWACGAPVPCEVREFYCDDLSLVHEHAYWSWPFNDVSETVLEEYHCLCPPLALAPHGVPAFQRAIDKLLHHIINEGFDEFLNTFWHVGHLKFSLLQNIYTLYQESGKSILLANALKLFVLKYISDRRMTITEEDSDIACLIHLHPDAEAVDRVMGCTLYAQLRCHIGSKLKTISQEILRGLQQLVLKRGKTEWPTVISVLCLLTMVIEKLQISAHLHSLHSVLPSSVEQERSDQANLRSLFEDVDNDGIDLLLAIYTTSYGGYHARVHDWGRDLAKSPADETLSRFVRDLKWAIKDSGYYLQRQIRTQRVPNPRFVSSFANRLLSRVLLLERQDTGDLDPWVVLT
ncbi:MAG: hypothetical protein M1812_000579 [Candelaria pacifica]|nr:MAG: hypothetical protein M1812_000579 [Candelaria pacifica]